MKIIACIAMCAAGASAFVTPTPSRTRIATGLASSMGSFNGDEMSQAQRSYFAQNPVEQKQGGYSAPARDGSPDSVMQKATQVMVQGGSLRTWALKSAAIERVQLVMATDGRPLNADLDLWHGPNNTPYRLRVYVEDGSTRPFNAIIETPRGPNTVAVRNTGQIEFPLAAYVLPNPDETASVALSSATDPPKTIQGGALKTYPFDSNVDSVQVVLSTDGRPMNARLELLQGPNNIKQIFELYVEDGMTRPFYCIIETPGSGNVVRIVNSASVEFPLTASVSPYAMGEGGGEYDIIVSGDRDTFGGAQQGGSRW